MKWYHKCNLDWLRARQEYLTASDIVSILPVTPTGKKRSETIRKQAMLNIYADKHRRLSDDDVCSYGAMARGHVLEPYAIEAYKESTHYAGYLRGLAHWDDVLVCDLARGLAYSPDAIDVPITAADDTDGYRNAWLNASRIAPTNIVEVKCYGSAAHYATAYKDFMECEERWQLAVAMAVSPTIETAQLVLFNPEACHELFIKHYSRFILSDEVDLIRETADEYWTQAKIWDEDFRVGSYSVEHKFQSIDYICADLLEKQLQSSTTSDQAAEI